MAGSPNHNRDELAATLDLILQNQQTFQTNLSTITTELQQLKASLVELQQFPSEICPNDHDSNTTTTMKLDNIPRFDGSDPLGWIFKITQFFDIHLTPEDQRLPIASFYMQEGEALTWFQRMHSNGQLLSWPSFLHALEIRFAAPPPPPPDDDPKGDLFKLCQTSSVKEYQAEFETLANRIVGLPPPFYLTCFISGLKSEIRTKVQAISLSQAINLAKLQEQKLNIDRPRHPTPLTKPTEAEATTSATSPTHNNHAGFNVCNWCG